MVGAPGPLFTPRYRRRLTAFERPPGVRLRSLLVGDSFLECAFLLGSPAAFDEQDLAAAVHIDMETINFGVSATGPRHYY
jgi:hypothetical protein